MNNRQPMTDEQRRAMFARLRGAGGGRSAGGGATPGSADSQPAGDPSSQLPSTGSSGSGGFQSLETPKTPSRRRGKSPGDTLLTDSEREALWTKLREGATDTRTLPPRSELSDERLVEIDQQTTEELDRLRRSIEEHRSQSVLDQFQTKFVHAIGDIAGGVATVIDPLEKLLDDPTVTGPLTRALEEFNTYTHTSVPDVAPEGAGPAIAALAGGTVPYIAGAEIAGGMSWLQKAISSLGKFGEVVSSWKTPVAAALTSLGIGKYRESNPTMDPRAEKALAIAQQLSGYVSALTGIGATKGMAKKAAPTLLEKSAARLKKIGEAISEYSESLAGKLPESVRSALGKIHGGYTKIADITGASWSDLKNVPTIRSMLDKAKSLREAAEAARTQADEIESAAHEMRIIEQNKATDILHASHKGSLADWESAQRMYGEGAAKWYAAEYGSVESRRIAKQMREQALKMEELAAQMTRDAKTAAVKGAVVAAGFTAKEVTEESRIRDLQQQMESAYADGDSFTLPAETPRGPMGTAGAFLLGTLGNPIEKQTRYGADFQAAQTANYRAKYDAIGRAEQSGELTSAEADAMRLDLATKEKPWNMAGKGPWTFAPASAAFLAWQGQQLSDYFNHEVEVGTVAKVLDGDTLELAGGKIVRMLGVDTPESVHPDKPVEYLGPEASHYQKDKLTGKTVRLVQSPGVDTDKYGRSLRYVETLPGPLDAAFNIPGVGKWIPGADQNENMIELGYGQPRYLELSGGHKRKKEYDAAVERAKRAGIGVWSPEGLQQLDYHYTPRGGSTTNTPLSDIGTLLGSGLMLTGQSGALKELGPAGSAIAQAWNAALAGIGVSEYNAKASGRTNSIVFRPPKGLKSDYESRAAEILKRRKSVSQRPSNSP